MYKRILVLSFVFMLAFSPLSVIAAEVDEANNQAEDTSTEVESEQTDVEGDSEAAENNEETETVKEEADDEEADKEEEADSNEEKETDEEEEVSTFATEDEDLNLSDVFGNASGDIEYDVKKGHYVLNLRAGFTTYKGGQDIENKWVAFALPNGVDIAGDLPTGVVRVFIAGKTGLAVKIPNIQGIGSESVSKEIPLTGEVDDNNPVYNTYMLNVDTEANEFEEIGELRGQREIDFSVMEENPSINLAGEVEGSTEFDGDKIHYFLNLTVDAENRAYENIDDLYVGFDIPEDVKVLDTEDTPEGFEQLNMDDKTIGAVRLPDVKEGESGSVTYRIPVIGKSDAVVESDGIQLFTFEDGLYNPVGNAEGSVHVDYSGMDQAWHFDTKSEVITDYPGVNDNQKGFRFNYSTSNLTVDDVEKVTMEFIVPDEIEIQKPEYIGGQNIDWDGNTATVDLDTIRGAETKYGYFTAVGNTSLTVEQLKDLQVKITLFRDGEEEVVTVDSPFVEGKYDEDDFGTPPKPEPGNGDDDEDEPGDGDNGNGGNDDNGDDNDKPGNDDDGTTPGNGTGDNDGTTPGSGDNGKGSDDDDVTIDVEDGDDTVVDSDTDPTSGDNELPKTATNTYTMMLFGALLILAGGTFVFVRKTALNK